MGICFQKQKQSDESFQNNNKQVALVNIENHQILEEALRKEFERVITFLSSKNFIVESVLGKGSYGIVVSAKQQESSYAIKIQSAKYDINSHQLGSSLSQSESTKQQVLKSFQNEADIMKKFKHPNIVQFHNQFTQDDLFYIVMEKCKTTLSDYYKQNKATLKELEIISIWDQLIAGMEVLHQEKVSMRDLKLENLLINDQHVIKYCDFGMSKNINLNLLTSSLYHVQGNAFHQPPEIFNIIFNDDIKNKEDHFKNNKIFQDEAGDVWALGIMMLELSGVTPAKLLLFNLEGGEIKTPNMCNEANAFIMKILQREKEKRPKISKVREDFNILQKFYANNNSSFQQQYKLNGPVNNQQTILMNNNNNAGKQGNQNQEQGGTSTLQVPQREIKVIARFSDDENSECTLKQGTFINDEMENLIPQNVRNINQQYQQFVYDCKTHEDPSAKELGIHKFKNGALYKGQWKNDQRHGRGIQLWPTGAYYVGYWKDNQPSGKGRLIHPDNDVYEGEWAFGKANGYGTYTVFDGQKYTGEWINDHQFGTGVEIWPDGAKYQGQFVNGKKTGNGKFYWPDGSQYEGSFLNNEISGHGRYIWLDGRIYKGDWKNNKMEGKGDFVWPDGRKYIGNYLEDKKQGYGEFFWPDGRKYKGQWVEGKQHGEGIYVNAQGEERRGEWKNGTRIKWLN